MTENFEIKTDTADEKEEKLIFSAKDQIFE